MWKGVKPDDSEVCQEVSFGFSRKIAPVAPIGKLYQVCTGRSLSFLLLRAQLFSDVKCEVCMAGENKCTVQITQVAGLQDLELYVR